MKKDTITQFVCFITNLEPEVFIPKWEPYAKGLMKSPSEPNLQFLVPEAKNRYRYVSQHKGAEQDFLFNFMKERHSEHFPEHNVKVIHAGGYTLLQVKKRGSREEEDIKLIVFASHNETDIDFYSGLPLYHHLNIYQAYFESCVYGYIMEFFVSGQKAKELEQLLKQRPGIETGMYKESLVHNI